MMNLLKHFPRGELGLAESKRSAIACSRLSCSLRLVLSNRRCRVS